MAAHEPQEDDMTHHLAQLNVATAASGDAQAAAMGSFWAEVPGVNALADADPGLIWRLQDEDSGNAGRFRIPGQDAMIVNLSVWADVRALHQFVCRSGHRHIMARKREWFAEPSEPTMVLWWVTAGHRPSVQEAWQRLLTLREQGPTPRAFTFKARFEAP